MLIKLVGSPGSQKSVPLMCRKCKKPIRQKASSRKRRGDGNEAMNAVGICKKCLK